MKSWKTTTSGVAAILTAIGGAVVLLLDADPATNPDWNVVMLAVITGGGLLFSRDNNVTSEEAGAKIKT